MELKSFEEERQMAKDAAILGQTESLMDQCVVMGEEGVSHLEPGSLLY